MNIIERAILGRRSNKYYIIKSFITGRWHVIHRGEFLHPQGDPTHIHARRRAHYHWKGNIR